MLLVLSARLESDGARWRYGVVRLSSAASTVSLDGRPVAAFAYYNGAGRTEGAYHNASHKAEAGK